ncbi:PREDICTED: F-box/LRR-repeat [Prunus dulcis]|uniref:PREDICTED: F-box/LRR-repeat n=1 Tax=Prunus dulcis TaxID=3755 RepID=A0A5E4EJ50_PRUDU|nr:hypothetical protein L3X38_038680 [Prunus dulcis]VVA15502.1 PREDICTED: F-box/LRR-repeat [Prunus dulcis]
MEHKNKLRATASCEGGRVHTESLVDRFSNLPLEVAHHILSFLDIEELTRFSCGSKGCRELSLSALNFCFSSVDTSTCELRVKLLNTLDSNENFRIITWIHNAVRCNVEVLCLDILLCDFEEEGCLELGELDIEDEAVFKWISCSCKCIKQLTVAGVRNIKRIAIESPSLERFNFYDPYGSQICILKISGLEFLGLNEATVKVQVQASGLDMEYWKLQNLDFIYQLEEVTIKLTKGSDGIEFARYILEHAGALEKMNLIYSPRQSDVIKKLNESKIISDATLNFRCHTYLPMNLFWNFLLKRCSFFNFDLYVNQNYEKAIFKFFTLFLYL